MSSVNYSDPVFTFTINADSWYGNLYKEKNEEITKNLSENKVVRFTNEFEIISKKDAFEIKNLRYVFDEYFLIFISQGQLHVSSSLPFTMVDNGTEFANVNKKTYTLSQGKTNYFEFIVNKYERRNFTIEVTSNGEQLANPVPVGNCTIS